jgi:hypothetical protein
MSGADLDLAGVKVGHAIDSVRECSVTRRNYHHRIFTLP